MSSRVKVPTSARRARSGMSLVEVIVAMTILTGVILVLGGFSFKFARATSQAHLVITANEIAVTQLDRVKQLQTYDQVEALAVDVDVVKEGTTFKQHTDVKRIGGATASEDYKYVTVSITHPGMSITVSKTTAIAAF